MKTKENHNYYYTVYGLNIESEIEISELVELKEINNIDIKLCYKAMPDKIISKIKKGKTSSYKRRESWFYIKDIAKYYIYKGSLIIVEAEKDSSIIDIKKFILGSCLGIALIQRNTVAIHGGTVAINNKAVILTGDSGAGKSTLTAAFRLSGYKFLSDDVSATIIDLENTKGIEVCSGYPRQKLCIDAMESMEYDYSDFDLIDKDRKKYSIPTDESFVFKSIPIGAIVEIIIGDSDDLEIKEVEGIDKVDIIMKNIYRIETMRKSGIYKDYLDNIIHIAKEVPVYILERPNNKLTVKEQINLIKNIGVL